MVSVGSTEAHIHTLALPALTNSGNMVFSFIPLVVIPIVVIEGMELACRISSTNPLNTVGSPPVIRSFVTPKAAKIVTSCFCSSSDNNSCCGVNSTPSSGMQYVQVTPFRHRYPEVVVEPIKSINQWVVHRVYLFQIIIESISMQSLVMSRTRGVNRSIQATPTTSTSHISTFKHYT